MDSAMIFSDPEGDAHTAAIKAAKQKELDDAAYAATQLQLEALNKQLAQPATKPTAQPAAPSYVAPPAAAASYASVIGAPAPAPVVATAPAPSYNLYNGAKYVTGNAYQPSMLSVGTDRGGWVPVTSANSADPEIQAQLGRSIATHQANSAKTTSVTSKAAADKAIKAMQSYLIPAR